MADRIDIAERARLKLAPALGALDPYERDEPTVTPRQAGYRRPYDFRRSRSRGPGLAGLESVCHPRRVDERLRMPAAGFGLTELIKRQLPTACLTRAVNRDRSTLHDVGRRARCTTRP
jgi:hypothetical protein